MEFERKQLFEDVLGGSHDDQISRDEIFEVLSNPRRRCVLHYLKRKAGGRVGLRELVEHVAAWENDTVPSRIDSDQRKRVYTALRQSHLPRLAKAGLVEYDRDRGDITLTEEARQVELYLERVPKGDIPWSEYYLGLSAVGAALVVVTWVGVGPFAGLSGLTLSAILLVLLTLSAGVHTYEAARSRIGAEEYEVTER